MRSTTPLVTIALAAAVLSTAACGGQDAGASAAGAVTSSGPAVTSSSPAKPGGTPTVTGPNLSAMSKDATAAQKAYVDHNAPPGVDAEAILQAGQDTCRRMQNAAPAADDSALVVAIVSGQIPNAEDAITYLCPTLKPTLTTARQGFTDGTFTVGKALKPGKQVPAGRYEALQPTAACTWTVTSAKGKIIAQGKGAASAITTLPAAGRFTSTACLAWVPA